MQSLKWLAKALAMVVCLSVFLAVGKLLQASFSLPFPGAIIGMMLLVVALTAIGRIPDWLGEPVDRCYLISVYSSFLPLLVLLRLIFLMLGAGCFWSPIYLSVGC